MFFGLFGVEKIASLLGDREFVGKTWTAFLIKRKIPFTIRIKRNNTIPNSRGILKPAKNFFRHLGVNQALCLGKRKVMGSYVYIVDQRLGNDE